MGKTRLLQRLPAERVGTARGIRCPVDTGTSRDIQRNVGKHPVDSCSAGAAATNLPIRHVDSSRPPRHLRDRWRHGARGLLRGCSFRRESAQRADASVGDIDNRSVVAPPARNLFPRYPGRRSGPSSVRANLSQTHVARAEHEAGLPQPAGVDCRSCAAHDTYRVAGYRRPSRVSSLQRDVTAVIGLLPYHLLDAAIHVSGRGTIADSDRQRAQQLINERRRGNGADAELFGIASGKNVIVVIAESLQAFTIGLEIDGQPVTPRLSAFVKESLYFSNFYDQTYLGTTADGEFTSLQSLHPLPVGVVAALYPTNHYRGLPAVLSEAGYSTMSAVAEAADFWYMNQMHRSLGFQRSYFLDSYNITDRSGGWSPDDEFFNQTVPFLKREERPFMAYLLTEGNHSPFRLPQKKRLLSVGNLEGHSPG